MDILVKRKWTEKSSKIPIKIAGQSPVGYDPAGRRDAPSKLPRGRPRGSLLLQSYTNKEIKLSYILDILKISRSRLFALLKAYRHNPTEFPIAYKRSRRTRSICPAIEKNVLSELAREKQLIERPDVPLHSYNYSYIRDLLWQKHRQKVSVATIIRRAKQHDFYLRRPKRKAHDRKVLTNYIGELIQHDSSYHRWSPLCSGEVASDHQPGRF